jgi:Cu2+-exporting ATPase
MNSYCLHCGLENFNQQIKFCCKGCELAYKIINNLGLQNYYQTRLLNQEIKALKPEENNQIDISEFCNLDEKNCYSINLMIEGLHCAACVWLIENVLKKQPSVTKARVNMTSRKLYLQWNGNKIIGNDLVRLISNLGYRLVPFDKEFLQAVEQKYDNQIIKSLAIAGFAAGNVMLISIALWANSSAQMGVATRNLLYWISAIIALPAIIYSGRIFAFSAINSIKSGVMNMDVPIFVAIILTSIISVFETINKSEHAYFDSAIMLIFFLLIGRFLDFSARQKAFSITRDLMMLAGTSATVIIDQQHKVVASKNLQKDMILSVVMGEKIAADGIIFKGSSEIDTSIITGESLPKKFVIGDDVFAGMVNLGDALQIKITKTKDETLLAKIVVMVENIETNKNRYTKIADVVARFYTPIIHLIALVTFLFWCFVWQIGWHQSLLNAVAVLIITCPCALALAVPVTQIIAAGKLLKKGILLKNSEALEKLNKIDTIVFDKTGTLTIGKPQLISTKIIGNESQIMQLVASMATKSNHILSKALTANFKRELLDLEVKEIAGMGLVSNYKGHEIRLGNFNHIYPQSTKTEADNNQKTETSQIFFKYQKQISVFSFSDQLRTDCIQTIKHLVEYNLIILSGDKESVVKSVAKELNISKYYFAKTPDQKLEIIAELKEQGKNILMVGDGINDSPALTLADISISPATACDINKNIADIIFQGKELKPVLEVINIAKKFNRIIWQNLIFALMYNLIAVPFAILGYIIPLFAALAMSFSSIIVVLNALRIGKKADYTKSKK